MYCFSNYLYAFALNLLDYWQKFQSVYASKMTFANGEMTA
jgi:hypothetical protein